jgi:hypothetical protein
VRPVSRLQLWLLLLLLELSQQLRLGEMQAHHFHHSVVIIQGEGPAAITQKQQDRRPDWQASEQQEPGGARVGGMRLSAQPNGRSDWAGSTRGSGRVRHSSCGYSLVEVKVGCEVVVYDVNRHVSVLIGLQP